jgi:hypothetical protein
MKHDSGFERWQCYKKWYLLWLVNIMSCCIHGLSIQSQRCETWNESTSCGRNRKSQDAGTCKTSDLLNVSHAVKAVAQDENHLVEACALVNVKLVLLEGLYSDTSNLNFDSTMQSIVPNPACHSRSSLENYFWAYNDGWTLAVHAADKNDWEKSESWNHGRQNCKF